MFLVKTEGATNHGPILAAVNIAAEDKVHQKLNDAVIRAGRTVEKLESSELHLVNAYRGSMNMISQNEVAKEADIPHTRAHIGDRAADTLISDVAVKIGAGMVVIGSVARKGIQGAMFGNTVEKILDRVETDVLTLITYGGDAAEELAESLYVSPT